MNLAVWAGLAGLFLGAVIMYCGFKMGLETGRNERDEAVFQALDPEGRAGRLPSEELPELVPGEPEEPASGKHHKTEDDPTPPGGFSLPNRGDVEDWPQTDPPTEQFEAVSVGAPMVDVYLPGDSPRLVCGPGPEAPQ